MTSHFRHPSAVSRWVGDALAVAVLVLSLWWLLPRDGGFATYGLAPILWWMVAAVPLAVVELRRLRRWTAVAVASSAVGLVASLVFAEFRSTFADSLSIYALMLLSGLAAHRLVRRSWGGRALITIVSGSLVIGWVLGAMVWWGSAGTPRWLVLSWHNQSAAFMAAGVLWFLGLAYASTGLARAGAVLAAGGSLAATLLAGSRGGTLALALAVAIVVVVRWKDRWVVTAVTAAVGAAIFFMFGLTFDDGLSPLERRAAEGSAEISATARFGHWEAGLGMFADDPVTGLGVGSYRAAAAGFNRAEVNLTSSAHNEYVELLAEGGLALAVPALALIAGGAVVGLRRVRAADSLMLAAGGMVLVLGAHAFIDFDWLFPSLAALFAVGLGAITAQDSLPTHSFGVPVGMAVAVAALGLWVSTNQGPLHDGPAPWFPVPVVNEALAAEHPTEALKLLTDAQRWNPGDNAIAALIPTYEALAGERDPMTLVTLMELPRTRFATYNLVAGVLADAGEYDAAVAVLEEALVELPAYVRWGPKENAKALWTTRLQVAYLDGGCEAFMVQADRLTEDPSFDLYGFALDESEGLLADCS